jgi:hypothetical protein
MAVLVKEDNFPLGVSYLHKDLHVDERESASLRQQPLVMEVLTEVSADEDLGSLLPGDQVAKCSAKH